MDVTVTSALTKYFNDGDGKRPLPAWRDELKALSDGEKRELAERVCAVTGWRLK